MSDDSVALAYLFSDIIFSVAAYALMRKYCQFRFSFNFRVLPGRRIFSVFIPGYANAFFGKYLLYILSMSVAGLGAMYSAIQSQASAILLLAELPAMGVCALLAIEISKNRGKWAVQLQFIKDSSSLMIFVPLFQLLHCLYSCCSMKYRRQMVIKLLVKASFPWCAKELRMWCSSMRQQFLVG